MSDALIGIAIGALGTGVLISVPWGILRLRLRWKARPEKKTETVATSDYQIDQMLDAGLARDRLLDALFNRGPKAKDADVKEALKLLDEDDPSKRQMDFCAARLRGTPDPDEDLRTISEKGEFWPVKNDVALWFSIHQTDDFSYTPAPRQMARRMGTQLCFDVPPGVYRYTAVWRGQFDKEPFDSTRIETTRLGIPGQILVTPTWTVT